MLNCLVLFIHTNKLINKMAKNCYVYETLNPVTEMQQQVSDTGLMTLSGVFGVCGVRNNNKRVYEKANYAKCVKEMQARIQENKGIPGELEHPQTMNITLENVSHKITKIDIDENGVVTGEIQLLNTPKGKIAQAIVEGGLPLFVSSRAVGNVDKSGNVTLENISSFDLVGTPGFSQAKMHLNESQVCESLGENTWCVFEADQADEETTPDENQKENDNMEEPKVQENATMLEKIEALEARIQELEDINETLQERVSEGHIDLRQLADGIQTWIVNDYSPAVQEWIERDLIPHVINESKVAFANNIAPRIQDWIVNDFAPEIERWVVEQYSPEVERWVLEGVAPGVQNWVIEHFAPQIETWLNETYMEDIKDQINESLKDTKDNKLQSITNVVSLLEGMDPTKPAFKGRQITEEKQINEPIYIAQMPDDARVKYNMASQEVKESIERRAKLFDFTGEGAIERFWESQNWEEQKPINPYKPLDSIQDRKERQIREELRRHRRPF